MVVKRNPARALLEKAVSSDVGAINALGDKLGKAD